MSTRSDSAPEAKQDAAGARDRAVLAIGAAVYLAWWFFVEALLPGSYNPLGGRLAVVGLLGGVAIASTVVPWVSRHLTACFLACMVALTAHYHWLFLHNLDHESWIIGEYITVLAVGTTFASIAALRVYLGACLAMALALFALRPDLRGTVFLAGLGTILVVQEIAHRTRARLIEAATTSRLQREHAERMTLEKSNFLNLVSHELITPLQAIQLTVEHLRRGGKAAEQPQKHLDRLAQSSERLVGLIQSLLDYGRLEREPLEPALAPFSLCALAASVIEEVRPQAEAKGLVLRCDVDPALPPIRSDERLVRIILVNVVGNAVKFTAQGSVVMKVEAGPAGDTQQVSVTDTGPGIPADAQAHIFQSFVQLEPMRNKHLPGAGLGLAIARDLARRLGAELVVTSTPSLGSTFSLQLR